MAQKWHISKNGEAVKCMAKIKCRLGGEHYDSYERAQKAIYTANENEFGLLPKQRLELGTEDKKTLANKITKMSGIGTPGFEWECFGAATVADRMGLEHIAVLDKAGETIGVSLNNKSSENIVARDRAIAGVKTYYEKFGVPIEKDELLARVVYYSNDEDNDSILVQSGGPNVLDAAVIEADEVVSIIEIKKLHEGGAQQPSSVLDINQNGDIKQESLDEAQDYIQGPLSKLNIHDATGTNPQLDFGSEDNNTRFPLRYLADEYKDKGATSFLYTSLDGEEVNEIDLRRPTNEIVDEMISKDISATVKLRANGPKQKVDKNDIYRFNNIVGEDLFKPGANNPDSETFILKDIPKSKRKKSGSYVRVGGFVLPIKWKGHDRKLNQPIDKNKMRAFRLQLTGDIKVGEIRS